ncbi:excalibur calcium-binding domain-containing protein [Nocardia brasiliensis]|uniref:excalibur calcium-binding domain-containing protein n=1 Tax=Nocardia brasiliensis TaxID=37326 RepID=UPI00351CD7F4
MRQRSRALSHPRRPLSRHHTASCRRLRPRRRPRHPPAPPAPSVYYPNCAAARAAGAAPLHRGAPGYRSALDRDGDGIACE